MSEAPYGSWPSSITAADLTAATVGLSGGMIDDGVRYWTQAHPEQGGRVTLWREDASGREEVTPEAYLRNGVNEYGGGEWAVAGGIVVYSNWPEGGLWVIEPGRPARQFTAQSGIKHAALRVYPDRRLALAVREWDFFDGRPVRTSIVAADFEHGLEFAGGDTLVQGADFYAHPTLSADGRLAWVEWNHPDMPWDATVLKVAPLNSLGWRHNRVYKNPDPTAVVTVAGGPGESVLYPSWSPDGALIYLSDRSGFWNFYRWDGERSQPLYPAPVDFCGPMWTQAPVPYTVIDKNRIGCSVLVHGYATLAVLHHGDGSRAGLQVVESDAVAATVSGGSGPRSMAVLGYPDRPSALVEVDWDAATLATVKTSSDSVLDPGLVSRAQAINWEGPQGEVHAWYYPPTNPDVVAPPGELPPVQVWSHGGPTAFSGPEYRLATQFWTSRGIGIVDVNYGGSSGYGRAYRERLRGKWGVVDVRDCADAARTLVKRKLADPARLSIRGGSAGGYTTLEALTSKKVFAAGISLYGVGDLEALATDTHKFEAHYLDGLVGPYPSERQLYRARSPIHRLQWLSCPMLILQGGQDKVVPPSQAEQMVAALRAKGLPVAYVLFPDEGHGFRRAENVIATAQAALAFLGRVHGFTPADDLPELDLH